MAKANLKKNDSPATGYTVLKEFRDAKNFAKVYSVGDDVSHFEPGRLAHLVKIGHVAGASDSDGSGETGGTAESADLFPGTGKQAQGVETAEQAKGAQ